MTIELERQHIIALLESVKEHAATSKLLLKTPYCSVFSKHGSDKPWIILLTPNYGAGYISIYCVNLGTNVLLKDTPEEYVLAFSHLLHVSSK